MALTDIIDFVRTKLLAIPVPGIPLVHSFQPITTEPADIPALMGSPVHFWSVRREATSEERRTNMETERRHTLVLRGHMEVGDPAVSEPLFQSLIEDVMLTFRQDYRIMLADVVIAELFGPMQVEQPVGWKILGKTAVVHYCEGKLLAQELIRRA